MELQALPQVLLEKLAASARTLTRGKGAFFSLFSPFAPVQSGGVGEDGGLELVMPNHDFGFCFRGGQWVGIPG